MKLLEVLVERQSNALNRPFSYLYFGNKDVGLGFRVLISFNNSILVGFVLSSKEVDESKENLEKEMGFSLNEIHDVLDDKPLLNNELFELSRKISSYYVCPLISVLLAMLPNSLKPSKSALKGPKISFDTYVELIDDDETGLTLKQIEVLRYIKENGRILKKLCSSQSILEKLYEQRKIIFVKQEKNRLVIPEQEKEQIRELTNDQINAVKVVLNTNKTVTLLQGVTGSGKTEVYLKICEEIIKQGKNVLMLVPEISLTPIMVEYFTRRFSRQVAVLHSELTAGEKYDEYRRIARGECKIVVGARSAIFAPLQNIGLIIMDEEHVESYKQDVLPYYHAREVALMRADYYKAKIVLGSATPSMESKARAIKGVYEYASLPNRINKKELPRTRIIDMSKGSSYSRESILFSKELIEELRGVLARNEQAILLINRRGYSGYVSCRSCGYIFRCPNCGVTLTYHRNDNMLKCHHCGHVETKPDLCPECGSKYLSKFSFGTERICEEINKLFPETSVLRLDSDVSEIRNNTSKILKKFKNQEASILVGTQMIAKGHDFPNVTLVGIVLADIGLSIPSYRSSERTFELLTQAVGRSGRAEKQGKAIIQTFLPSHYAIQLAAKQDYESFFIKEMEARKLSKYPPYTFLTSVEIVGKNKNEVIAVIGTLANMLVAQNIENVTVLGPIEPYISYENSNYHRVILIKYKNSDKINRYLINVANSLKSKTSINIKINVDPYNY